MKFTGLPPPDMRQYNKGPRPYVDSSKWMQPSEQCHAFFEFAYENLAEPLAEGAPNEDNMYLASEAPPDEEDIQDSEPRGCLEADLDDNIVARWSTSLNTKETKWLAYHTIPDLYDESMSYWVQSTLGVDQVPSPNTFRRVLALWANALKIRALGQHARCTVCAELAERLAKTADPQERVEILAS